MLKIKQKFHLSLPHFTLRSHRVEFSPPTAENDELIAAIDTAAVAHDDDWQLSERPDSEQLAEYWDEVEDDIRHDPQWIQVEE